MSEERSSPFTGAGKVLFLVTLAITGGGMAWVFLGLLPNMPAGSYPVFILLGPVIIFATLFFFAVAAGLRRKGIAVLVSEKEEIDRRKKERAARKAVGNG